MRVLVIEDDDSLRIALRRALVLGGFDVEVAADGKDGLEKAEAGVGDVIILDLGLPLLDGTEICRRLRGAGDRTPILMLTARDAVEDRVAGLEAGADDYLVKPYDVRELRARLRRSCGATSTTTIRAPWSTRAWSSTRPPTAFAFRASLCSSPAPNTSCSSCSCSTPAACSPRTSSTTASGAMTRPGDNSLRVYIGYLRRKLEAGGERRLIQTVHGVGYVLREP